MTAEELFKLAEDAEKNNELEKAAEYYEQAANLGNVPAMLKFSTLKFELENPDPDAAEDLLILGEKASKDRNDADAVKYFEQAANAGNVRAMVRLGQIYELENFSFMGRKIRDNNFFDEKKAFYWYKKAADAGNFYAMNAVGYMYSIGVGVEKNIELGNEYIEKASQYGDGEALYNMALVEKDATKKLELLKKSAEYGFYDAMTVIAEMYEYGKGVEEDLAEACIWYARAVHDWDTSDTWYSYLRRFRQKAEQGDPDAMWIMGRILEAGYGHDFVFSYEEYVKEALNWYKKAADAGNEKAIDYFNQMALDNFDDYFKNVSKKRMPGFKLPGAKTPKERWVFLAKKAENDGNRELAFNFYLKAAEKGDAFSMFKVGNFYTTWGYEAESFKWNLKAAELGAPYAMSEVATMYFKGAGVEKNEAEGLKWLKKSAELNYAPAMSMLARMYEIGMIVEPDIHEALKWYVEAANAGEEHAQERLKILFDEGN